MASKAPAEFNPELTDARLRIVSEALLDVLYETELELATPLDDGYTRGTATFGRQRNTLIQLCQSGQYGWLKLTNPAMDVTFEIGGVPCRFFADDPSKPSKPGFYRRNDSDQLFEIELSSPVMFRFVVAKAQSSDEEADVYFIGYDANQQEVFRWQHSLSTPVLASVDESLPKEIPLPPAAVKVRKDESDQDQAVGDYDDPQG